MDAVNWLVAHKVGLILGWLATSLLNNLTAYPVASEVNVLSKGLNWLLDAVSFLSSSNVEQGIAGFLKIPVFHRAGKVLNPKPAPILAGSNAVKSPWLVAVAAAVLGLAASSCAQLKPLPSQLAQCAESVAPSAIATAAPQVSSILSGQSVNWQSALSSLITNVGLPAVVCAVQQLVADLSSQSVTSQLSAVQQITLVRAQAWLNGVLQGAGH